MKLKNTLILLVLAVAIYAFIRIYESGQLSTREAQEQAGRVVTFDRDKMDAITIKNSEAKIELRKDGKGVWRLEEPVKDRADTLAVSQLFTTAEELRHDAAVGDDKGGADREQLKDYGLANSEIKLKFSGKDKPVELIFGKDTAVEGKVYVKRDGSNVAYVIGKDLKEQISKKVDDFRDRRLTDVIAGQVHKVTIKTSSGEIEADKKDQHWSIVKPLKARADDSRMGDLISIATTAHIDSFIADSTSSNNYGLQEPRVTMSVWAEGNDKPTVLQIGANPKDEKDKEKSYAKVSTREGVVLIEKTIDALINTKPNDLRDKQLLRFEPDIVDRINIEGAGKEKIVLARKGESWVRKAGDKEEAINVAAARRLLDDLRQQKVMTFVSDVATDLPKYGLDQPQVKITLSSYASENTPETKAGERPIATVDFGKVEEGKLYARLEDEPFIVAVAEGWLETLMTDPAQWQPVEIHRYKADDITAVEVAKDGQAPIALERDKDKAWKLAKGDGAVNQINAQSLVNTLATLRAVRWIGSPKPDDGMDKPSLTISFRTKDGGGKVIVGELSPDTPPHAAVESAKGVFELSKPDLSAFQLSLLEKPAAQATPIPVPPPATDAPATPAPPPVPAPPPQ